jgi:hypothetical protein
MVISAKRNSIWKINKIYTYIYTEPIPEFGNAKRFEEKMGVFQKQFFIAHMIDNNSILINYLESLADLSSEYLIIFLSNISTALIAINTNTSIDQARVNSQTLAAIHEANINRLADYATKCLFFITYHYN